MRLPRAATVERRGEDGKNCNLLPDLVSARGDLSLFPLDPGGRRANEARKRAYEAEAMSNPDATAAGVNDDPLTIGVTALLQASAHEPSTHVGWVLLIDSSNGVTSEPRLDRRPTSGICRNRPSRFLCLSDSLSP